MRLALCALALGLGLFGAPSARAEDPQGWEECLGLVAHPEIWPVCAKAVSADCVALRAEEGDKAWAVCLKTRAEAWEDAMVTQSLALRARNNPAGSSAALSRWMASRASRCHRQSEVERMTAEFGETLAAAAVFQCELASNIEEAMRLADLVEAE